jgi:hypothetical protein
MKRSCFLCILLAVALMVPACGSSGNGNGDGSVKDYLPASGEITGWAEDTAKGEPGPEETGDLATATLWVDGAMDIFVDTGGWVALAQEHYKNASDVEISLHIYEMTEAAKADEVYVAMQDYAGVSWTDTAFGGGESNGRFGTVFTYCYADATKGKYFVETTTKPVAAETEAKDFIKAVLNKIP